MFIKQGVIRMRILGDSRTVYFTLVMGQNDIFTILANMVPRMFLSDIYLEY